MKDIMGNDLAVGQSVQLKAQDGVMLGVVRAVEPGHVGRVVGGQKLTPGMLTVVVQFDIPVDPSDPVVRNVVRVYRPGEGQEMQGPALIV